MRRAARWLAVCGMVAGVSGVALAQPAESDSVEFNGRWTARYSVDGRPRTATLSVMNFGGTWQDTSNPPAAVDKVCRGKKLPVTVQNSTHAELAFTAWGSSISPACPDLTVTLAPVDERTLEGTIAPGGAVTLTRQLAKRAAR